MVQNGVMWEYNSTTCYRKEHASSTDKVKDIVAVCRLGTVLLTFMTPHLILKFIRFLID